MQRIDKQDDASAQTEMPEGLRHYAAFRFFAGEPLAEKTHHEQRLADDSDQNPKVEVGLQPGGQGCGQECWHGNCAGVVVFGWMGIASCMAVCRG